MKDANNAVKKYKHLPGVTQESIEKELKRRKDIVLHNQAVVKARKAKLERKAKARNK